MNKFLCRETKKRGKFKAIMCQMCSYKSRCADYGGFTHREYAKIDENIIADVLDTELPWRREDLLKLAIKIKEALLTPHKGGRDGRAKV